MITDRMQASLLYRYFATDEECADEIELSCWRWPWREVFLHAERISAQYGGVIIGMTGRELLRKAVEAAAGSDEEAVRAWWATILDSTEPIHYPTLAELAESLPPVRWLWPGWIPRGMISLLGAFQGTGKSYFVMDLARTVIHGGAWPDGTPAERIGRVIYVDAEAIPQVNNERAVKMQINRHQLYLLMAGNGELLDLTAAKWQDRLMDMAAALKPELIIIDSYSSISSSGQNSVEDTARLLAYLGGLATATDAGLLVLHHLRKPSTGQMALPGMNIHDFRGSGNITAMARSVMGLSVIQTGKQFSLNGPRRLDLVKTNLGPYPDSIGIEMETAGDLVRFKYGKAPRYDQESPGESCEEWLIGYLEEHGDSKPADVIAAAEEAGFTKATLYRTRKKLNAVIFNTHANFRHPANCWTLDGEEAAEDDGEE